MFDRIKREGGFTLIEIVVILAVIAIIAAAMVPRISGIMDDAKISRAGSEVQTIGMGILRFNANTGKWPARDSSGSDNAITALISGTALLPVPSPNYTADYSDGIFLNSSNDYFDNHLKNNSPGGSGTYPADGINRWNGPYLQQVTADPWGNAYICNIISAYSNDLDTNLYCYVISAGPDGTIQTNGQVQSDDVATHAIGGDDVAFLIRARR